MPYLVLQLVQLVQVGGDVGVDDLVAVVQEVEVQVGEEQEVLIVIRAVDGAQETADREAVWREMLPPNWTTNPTHEHTVLELEVVLLSDGSLELLGLLAADVEGAEALEGDVGLEVNLVQRALRAVALDGLVEGLVAVLDLAGSRLAEGEGIIIIGLGGVGVGADLVHIEGNQLLVLPVVVLALASGGAGAEGQQHQHAEQNGGVLAGHLEAGALRNETQAVRALVPSGCFLLSTGSRPGRGGARHAAGQLKRNLGEIGGMLGGGRDFEREYAPILLKPDTSASIE